MLSLISNPLPYILRSTSFHWPHYGTPTTQVGSFQYSMTISQLQWLLSTEDDMSTPKARLRLQV